MSGADVPETLPGAVPARGRRGRVAAALALGIAALAAAAILGWQPLLRYLVHREAQRLGVDASCDSVDLARGSAVVHGLRVRLDGVRGLAVRIDEVRAALDGTAAKSLDARGVAVTLDGSAADALLDLGAWSTAHPDLYRMPGAGRAIALTWSATPGEAPWLTLADGTLTTNGSHAEIQVKTATFGGVAVGAVSASWLADTVSIAIALGRTSLAEAPIRVDVRPLDAPPTAELTLRPTKLEQLGAPLGLALPAPGAVVEGNAKLALGARDAITGTTAMTLTGWIPPHPRELGGIVFGDKTTFSTKLEISADRRRVTLSDAAVAAGAFKLKGTGQIDREADHATAKMDLSGAIACSDVARSAAASSLGDAVGQLVGQIARVTVRGSVAIGVHLEADTRDLAGAKVRSDVGVGCGLRLVPQLF